MEREDLGRVAWAADRVEKVVGREGGREGR